MHRFLPALILLLIFTGLPLSGQASSFQGGLKSLPTGNIDRQDHMGRTVLMKAVRGGDAGYVSDILYFGADPDIRDSNGQTALFHALQYSTPEVIDLLLDVSSLEDPYDRAGRSLLDLYIARAEVYSPSLFNAIASSVTDPEDLDRLLHKGGESVIFKLMMREEAFRNAALRDVVFLGCSLDERNTEGRTPYEEALARPYGGFDRTAQLLKDIREELNQTLIYEIYSNPGLELDRAGFFLSRGASADYLNVNGFNSCHYAVSAGRPDLLEFLLDWDTEADPLADERVVGLIPFFTLNKEYETAVSLLNILFDRGISPNSRDGNERTLMDQAITYSLPLASYILSSGASPDLVSPGGVTPMMKLMTMNMEGDFSLLHELAAAGADMRVKDDEGKSIMLYAVLYGQSPDVLKTLMELGISIDIRDDYGTPAFFFVSAFQNSPDFQLPLLSEDERFLRRDKDGWTPLHGALNFGNAPELIDTLATLYPDGYLIDGTGRSLEEFRTAYEELYGPQDMPELTRLIGSRRIYPAGELPLFFDPDEELRIIVEKGRDPELVSLFVAEGADLSLHYSDGFSPVLTASAFNSAAMVRALLDEGATVFDSTPYGWTPLHVASWRSDPETAALLIEEGLNVNARDFDYWTPLHWAARNNPSREYLEILLASGADPALKTYRNDTPLHLACQGWVEPSSDTIELLLQGGADIDAPNASGATALMLAAGQGYGEACRLLLASGADNRRTDSDGMTAAMWAAERQYDDLAEFLREAE